RESACHCPHSGNVLLAEYLRGIEPAENATFRGSGQIRCVAVRHGIVAPFLALRSRAVRNTRLVRHRRNRAGAATNAQRLSLVQAETRSSSQPNPRRSALPSSSPSPRGFIRPRHLKI